MHRNAGKRSAVLFHSTVTKYPKQPVNTTYLRSLSSSAQKKPREFPTDQTGQLNRLTNELIERNVHHGNNWKKLHTMRGEEKKLERAILRKPAVARTVEHEQFAGPSILDDIYDEADAPASDINVPPGTFVEVRRNNVSLHGIVLGELFLNNRWETVSLNTTGEVWTHLKEDIMFTLPALVPQDLTLRCGMVLLAETPVQINARIELLRRLRLIEVSLQKVQHFLSARTNALYSQVRSSHPDEWAQVTINEAIRLIAPDYPIDFLTRFAIHKHLMNTPQHFVADPVTYRTSEKFDVRPQSHVERLETVTQIVRRKEGPLQSFAQRAKPLILESQARALESWTEAPSNMPRSKNVLTPDDAIIIDFLRDSLRVYRSTQKDPYSTNVSQILKACGTSLDILSDSEVRELLINLDAMAPWSDIVSQRKELDVDHDPPEISAKVAEQEALIKRALDKPRMTRVAGGQVLGPEDFYSHDLLESVRHDFGDQQVFVIDDIGAEELDDGFSIESIPSEPGSTWVHVHIADPTAVLPPNHVFSQQARKQQMTMYFAHRTWPMLPPSLMRTFVKSVGELAAEGEPENVLSFSFKVDATGEIVDQDVRAGIIRNVRKATYDQVDHLLGHPLRTAFTYPFGGQPETPIVSTAFNKRESADLRAVGKVVDRMRARLARLPMFMMGIPKAHVSMSPHPLYSPKINSSEPPIFRGYPTLTFAVEDGEKMAEGARGLVATCMSAASRVASRWALARGVPLLRRSSGQPMTLSDEDFVDLLDSRKPSGYLSLNDALSKNITFPSAQYTMEPGVHWSLGVPEGEGYSRVTSPLRRYNDMVAHWQIKHALLHPDSSTPLFSSEWMQDFGRELGRVERTLKIAEKDHSNFWALSYLDRVVKDPARQGQPGPLDKVNACIATEPKGIFRDVGFMTKVVLPELGIRATLSGGAHFSPSHYPIGSMHQLEIKNIHMGTKAHLYVKPINASK